MFEPAPPLAFSLGAASGAVGLEISDIEETLKRFYILVNEKRDPLFFFLSEVGAPVRLRIYLDRLNRGRAGRVF